MRRARQDAPPEYVQGQHQTDDLEDETHIVRLAVPRAIVWRKHQGQNRGRMLEVFETRAILVG